MAMDWTHVLEFPQSSVARHVRVIVYSWGQAPPIVASVKVTVGSPSQLSVAAAMPNAVFTAGFVLAVHCIVMLAGQDVITGGVLSSMKMAWLQVLEFPQSSVARQVRVMVYSCGQAPPTVTSVKVMVGVPSQLSVAVAMPSAVFTEGFVLAVHWIVMLAGQVIEGARLSSITISWLHALEFPHASVAVQVRVIAYSCGQAPPAVTSEKVMTGALLQLSVAVAMPSAGLVVGLVLAVHWIVILAGQVIDGGTLSSTKMSWVHVLEFPQSSVAVHVRVMADSPVHPPGEVASAKVIVGVPSQLSVAVAMPSAIFTAGFVLAEHSMVTFAGQVIAGATLSSTTMTCVQVLALPQSSVASQVRVIVRSCGQAPATVASV
jgi:hypothetical protein